VSVVGGVWEIIFFRPLHKAIFNPAVRVLMVKLLIKHGADVNIATSVRGDTALHYAVQLGRLDLLKVK
jgi:ankyrin repeat protein